MMMTVYRHHDDTNDNIDGIEVMQLKKDKWEAWVVDILVEGFDSNRIWGGGGSMNEDSSCVQTFKA